MLSNTLVEIVQEPVSAVMEIGKDYVRSVTTLLVCVNTEKINVAARSAAEPPSVLVVSEKNDVRNTEVGICVRTASKNLSVKFV